MTKVKICTNTKKTEELRHLSHGDYFWFDDKIYIKTTYNNSTAYIDLESGDQYCFKDTVEVLHINNINICVED